MIKKLCIVFGLIAFWACGEKLMTPPEDLIPKDKMITILKELTVINSAKKTNAGVLHDYNIEPTVNVFTKYGVDSVQFVISDRYYASIPLEYEAMYRDIEKQLDLQKEQVTQNKHLNDSLELQKKIKNSVKKKNDAKKPVNVLQ